MPYVFPASHLAKGMLSSLLLGGCPCCHTSDVVFRYGHFPLHMRQLNPHGALLSSAVSSGPGAICLCQGCQCWAQLPGRPRRAPPRYTYTKGAAGCTAATVHCLSAQRQKAGEGWLALDSRGGRGLRRRGVGLQAQLLRPPPPSPLTSGIQRDVTAGPTTLLPESYMEHPVYDWKYLESVAPKHLPPASVSSRPACVAARQLSAPCMHP